MAERTGLRRAWDEFVGPEATRANSVLTVVTSAAGLLGAGWAARRAGARNRAATLLALLAVDIVGGAYVNNTRACARWYECPGQGSRQHLQFAALHAHPAVVAYSDHAVGRRDNAMGWSLAHYGYMMAATVVIRSRLRRRRPLGFVLTAGGLVLDRVLGPSHTAPWFAWAYYPKLLMGHAGASLWSDAELR